jgi:hypothetical protein
LVDEASFENKKAGEKPAFLFYNLIERILLCSGGKLNVQNFFKIETASSNRDREKP